MDLSWLAVHFEIVKSDNNVNKSDVKKYKKISLVH